MPVRLRVVPWQTVMPRLAKPGQKIQICKLHWFLPLRPPQWYAVYQWTSKVMVVSSEVLKDNDEITKFYTGMLLWKVFHHLVCSLSTCCPNLTSSRTKKVSPSNGLLLTLMRLRVNLWMKDLSYHFSIPISTITNVFQKFITTIHVHLKFLIEWSTHGTCYKHVSDI